MDIPPPRLVRTVSGPGNRAEQMAAAVMPPRIWAKAGNTPRTQGRAPMRHIPRVTAELNSPPLIQKKIQLKRSRKKGRYITIEMDHSGFQRYWCC